MSGPRAPQPLRHELPRTPLKFEEPLKRVYTTSAVQPALTGSSRRGGRDAIGYRRLLTRTDRPDSATAFRLLGSVRPAGPVETVRKRRARDLVAEIRDMIRDERR
jgi:hypothetical protein